jgi:hypothetical protein
MGNLRRVGKRRPVALTEVLDAVKKSQDILGDYNSLIILIVEGKPPSVYTTKKAKYVDGELVVETKAYKIEGNTLCPE